MIFKNPQNDYQEKAENCFLWCLLFGSIYLLYKGAWGHAIISFVSAVVTYGVSWIAYPFFAKEIVRKNYFQKGWVEVQA